MDINHRDYIPASAGIFFAHPTSEDLMTYRKIRKFSHYFTVNTNDPDLMVLIHAFMESLIEKNWVKYRGRFKTLPKRVWCRRSLRNGDRAFSIEDYPRFIRHMEKHQVRTSTFDIETVPSEPGYPISLSIDKYVPWPDQTRLIDFAKGPSSKYIITLQPGGGKTLIALFLAQHHGVRFSVITRGGYQGRWLIALYNVLGLEPNEVRSCCGAQSIVALIEEKKRKGIDEVKAIFMSIGGLRDYIKRYESGRYVGTVCENVAPEDLNAFLGIGFKIVDEVHQETHANYLVDLYTNLEHSVYLTGTLIPTSPFIRGIYARYLPESLRMAEEKFNVYVKAVEVIYALNEPEKVSYLGPQGNYHHITYEQWIMGNKERLDNWVTNLISHINKGWVSTRKEETRIIVFASTVELNAIMTERFSLAFPHLRVVQYKANDPYQRLLDSDIIFATLGKAGTAVDIPDLEQVHLTTAVDSPNAYIQAFGRLREMKQYPDMNPEFHWYSCQSIQKHVEYSKRKRTHLFERIVGITEAFFDTPV